MKINKLLFIIPLVICGVSCSSGAAPSTSEQPITPLTQLTKFNGKSVDIEDSRLYDYLAIQDEHEAAKFLFLNQPKGQPLFKTDVALTFDWYGGAAPYEIKISENADFSNATYTKSMNMHNIDVASKLFKPNTQYYVKVSDSKGESFSDNFVTKDSPVIYTVDGTSNVRDIGGWKTSSGKRVKFNKLFRGANVDYLTDAGKYTFLHEMNIKTDLDLRGANASEVEHMDELLKNGSPSGCEKFINARINTYNDITTYPSTQNPVYKQAFEALAEPSNYPMYFHCTHGADRTGTLAFLLGGLLGVSLEDLTRDFELTSFYYTMTRWRSSISSQDGVYSFGESGSQASDIRFGPLYKDLMETWGISHGAADESLQAAVENYLLNGLGITLEQINNIKNELVG